MNQRIPGKRRMVFARSQIRSCGQVVGMILLGPGEVLILIIITAVVVLLAVRGRNINK